MMDFAAARAHMVESQVRPNDVPDMRIQEAMGTVPRERFVPKAKQALAYSDQVLDIAPGRILIDPRAFAKLLQAAEIKDTDIILDVGCGRGYSAAVLARLGEAVIALEDDDDLIQRASHLLMDRGVDNAAVVKGPLTAGYGAQGPYDVILINGGVHFVPEALRSQLSNGGRLVCIMMDPKRTGEMGKGHVFERSGNTVTGRYVFDAALPLLEGFVREPEFAF